MNANAPPPQAIAFRHRRGKIAVGDFGVRGGLLQHKPHLLAAFPTVAFDTLEKILGEHVELVPVTSMQPALQALERDRQIALVLSGVHFDSSRMYDLLRYVRQRFSAVPFVCCRVFSSELPQISREAIALAAQTLGAAGFVDLPALAEEFGQQDAEQRLRAIVLGHLPLRSVKSV
jgi:CheY-like chemotaxis protein